MIIFNVLLSDETKAGEISRFLIDENYALQTHIDTNTIVTTNGDKRTVRLFFITKALLYTAIEEEIHKRFFSDEMILYATPVSHVNKEFGELLRSKTRPV